MNQQRWDLGLQRLTVLAKLTAYVALGALVWFLLSTVLLMIWDLVFGLSPSIPPVWAWVVAAPTFVVGAFILLLVVNILGHALIWLLGTGANRKS